MTVYHQLLNKEVYRANTVPSAGSLYEESQALMFGGGDTTGHALMVGTFHLIQKQPRVHKRLREELLDAWSQLEDEPTLRSLEKLPYLTAVIKEALRMDSGVVSGLARVVPDGGASIDGTIVPRSVGRYGEVQTCGADVLIDHRFMWQHFCSLEPLHLPQSLRVQTRALAGRPGPR
jgi:Cytochrome P450